MSDHRNGSASAASGRSFAERFAEHFEAVEPRRLLSASLGGGKLTVLGTGAADTISLQLVGGTTLRVIDNGVNRDFAAAGVTSINVSLSGGADKFTGTDAIAKPMTVTGSAGNDTLTGNAGSDVIYGNDGNDTLDGRAGADTLSGQNDVDSISGGNGADKGYGGEGADTIWAFRDASMNNSDNGDQAFGGNGNDTLNGSSGADTLNGEGDNDTIVTAKYWDGVLNPATGADSATGGDGNDTISAFGSNGNCTVRGGAGNDSITGSYGEDSLFGDAGEDTLIGVEGVDTIYGGNDNDTLTANTGGTGGIGDELFGDAGNDLLQTDAPATLHGGAGNDDLKGIFSLYFGDEGDDYLFSKGTGNDTLDGGDGFDRGVNVKRFGSPTDTFTNIERFL